MLEMLMRYANEGYLKFDKADIWFGKERISLYFVVYSAGEFQLNSMANGWRYLVAKFMASRKEGRILIQQHGAADSTDLTSIISVSLTIMNTMGMGTFKIVESDKEKGFVVVKGVSTLALEIKEDKPSELPADFVIGGILAGAVKYYTKKQTYGVEASCVSQNGANECTWVIGDRPKIIEYLQKSFPDQVAFGNENLDQIVALEAELAGTDGMEGII